MRSKTPSFAASAHSSAFVFDMNGVLVVDNVTLENYWDRKRPIFPVEQLELQCHGDPIEWRNIFIREL